MLVLSALYKAESLITLGDTPPNVIHDLLAKCDAYVEKYNLQDDKDITESIRSKKKSLLRYQTTKNADMNSYDQLEEVRQTPVAKKQMSPKNVYPAYEQSKAQVREPSAGKKNFVVKSKRGVSTEARISDNSYGSTTRTVTPLDYSKPGKKSPRALNVRRPSRDLVNTPNSLVSQEPKERENSYTRKRNNGPRLTHNERNEDFELSYATMRQSHGAEGGKGNFFKPKIKNHQSRFDTDGSDPMVVQKDFLEDSERFEPEPEPGAEKPQTIGSPSFATKSTRPKSAVKIQSSQAKKGFKEGLEGLLKLGDYLKSQIEKEVEDEERRKRKKALGQKIFEDSFSGLEKSSMDKEISGKMNELLSSVAEWEKQRLVFQDRFQRLEQALEKQQTPQTIQVVTRPVEQRERTNSKAPDISQKPGPYINKQLDEGSANLLPRLNVKHSPVEANRSQEASGSRNSFKEPIHNLGQRKSLKGPTTPLSVGGKSASRHNDGGLTPQGVPILSKNASAARSLMSVQSGLLNHGTKEVEDFASSLESCLMQLQRGLVPETEILHNLDHRHLIVFDLKTKVSAETKKPEGCVILKLLKDNELLGEETLNTEDLRSLFQQVNLADTFSYHIPVTAYPDITVFLQHCLAKFISFGESSEGQLQPEVFKLPKSLIEEPVWTNFLGEDCTATLIHLYMSTFRLIIRPPLGSDGEIRQGYTVDIIFNEFVMSNFFHAHNYAEPAELVEKVAQGTALSVVERAKLKRYITSQHSCILLSEESAKVVRPGFDLDQNEVCRSGDLQDFREPSESCTFSPGPLGQLHEVVCDETC